MPNSAETPFDPPRACLGGDTIPTRMGMESAHQCAACGTKVRNDLVEHPFFGFRNSCPQVGAATL